MRQHNVWCVCAWRATQHTVNTTGGYPPTTMSSAGFETTIPVIKRLETYAVDRTASGIRWPTITHHYVLVFRCPVSMNHLDKTDHFKRLCCYTI